MAGTKLFFRKWLSEEGLTYTGYTKLPGLEKKTYRQRYYGLSPVEYLSLINRAIAAQKEAERRGR